jgi:hypothetical protein
MATPSPPQHKAEFAQGPADRVTNGGTSTESPGAATTGGNGAPANGSAASSVRPHSSMRAELEQLEAVGRLSWSTAVPSWLLSAVVHMALLVVLGLLLIPDTIKEQARDLLSVNTEKADDLEEIKPLEQSNPVDIDAEATDIAEPIETDNIQQEVEISNFDDAAAAQLDVKLSDFSDEHALNSDLMSEIGSYSGRGLEGRGEAARKKLVAERGGSEASEAAVARALRWLIAHQYPDGSWSFDHTRGECQGACPHPGSLGDSGKLGATGLGLLPFLGAGQTHRQGEYKEHVNAALYFLVQNMQLSDEGGSLRDGGNMYSHGIAAIAMCEAYAMTEDPGLAGPAQQALNYIMYAQDPVGGGWRYSPRQPGDTSVVGWQLMALKSGNMAYLRIDPRTIAGVENFLNSVQSDSGAKYGYTNPGAGPATTAVGLLCRMYLGWGRDHAALRRGVQSLADRGPSKSDMYFNYYATQVLHHYEGEPWQSWNPRMRDFLVNTQAMGGHEQGSWHFKGAHGADTGGRHYSTTMATMILEVYYRHLPIYKHQASENEFDD